jgi:transcriptional regulator with XRE-family HTH domain
MAVRRSDGWPVAEIAEAAGVSARTVYKWLARGSAQNRSSRARRVANRLPDPVIAEIARLRRDLRLTAAAIARRLKLARATVAGWLKRLGLGRLKLLDPKPLVRRYERQRAGELVHVESKSLGVSKRKATASAAAARAAHIVSAGISSMSRSMTPRASPMSKSYPTKSRKARPPLSNALCHGWRCAASASSAS